MRAKAYASNTHDVYRAFAKRGESWRPFDVREEAAALFFGVASSLGFA
jgi:hypothetical protein